MNTFKQLALAGACSLALAGAPAALAQSTDGYHSIQVFPVVVDTAAFTQRFTFRNPDANTTITIVPTYVPGDGTSQVGVLSCPGFTVAAASSRTFMSLREICPTLAAGSQFGYLYTREDNTGSQPFAAFSRVSNPAGQGFSVEAFPAHTFTSADQSISGLRRLAASGGAPAYQTNCFIGNLHDVTPENPPETTRINYTLIAADGTTLASSFFDLPPGRLVRMLDVFATAGAPAGNHDGARIKFVEAGQFNEPALMSFCTVQDNTSFGADFRIGKQVQGTGVFQTMFEVGRVRDVAVSGLLHFSGTTPSLVQYQIQPGPNANTHILYFRHPDVVGCSLLHPTTNQVASADYGLELRMLARINDTATWEPVAGGDMASSFANLYLGDKHERGNGGDTVYMLQVESNGFNEGALRPYKLRCTSGSGHTLGELIQVGGPVTF